MTCVLDRLIDADCQNKSLQGLLVTIKIRKGTDDSLFEDISLRETVFREHYTTARVLSTMKALVAAVLVTALVVEAQIYTERFDNINIEEVLSNKRLLTAYIKCVLDKGRCTPEGKELKSHITDALQTGCDSCTDVQKDGVRKVIGHLVKNEQDYWKELVEKYDPEGAFSQKYEDELKSI